MPKRVCVADEPAAERFTIASPPETSGPRRYRYQRVEADSVQDVIVDILPSGAEEWFEQYPGELRWYPFTPSAKERELLRGWQINGYIPEPQGTVRVTR
jgi:hypothetical protein